MGGSLINQLLTLLGVTDIQPAIKIRKYFYFVSKKFLLLLAGQVFVC